MDKIFHILQNSTLPKLMYELDDHFMERYNITNEMMQNVAVTFSMYDPHNGRYKIANKAANLEIIKPNIKFPEILNFKLSYKFSLKDTKIAGNFEGEFKIDFLGQKNCGKLSVPLGEKIHVIIHDSITKTTVI